MALKALRDRLRYSTTLPPPQPRAQDRLFGDFGYDACVILRNPAAFKQRFLEAVQKQLLDYTSYDIPLLYVDPYNFKKGDLNVFTSKHLRYWYQHEYRFGWVPPVATQSLSAFFVELGDLSADADLIVLED